MVPHWRNYVTWFETWPLLEDTSALSAGRECCLKMQLLTSCFAKFCRIRYNLLYSTDELSSFQNNCFGKSYFCPNIMIESLCQFINIKLFPNYFRNEPLFPIFSINVNFSPFFSIFPLSFFHLYFGKCLFLSFSCLNTLSISLAHTYSLSFSHTVSLSLLFYLISSDKF